MRRNLCAKFLLFCFLTVVTACAREGESALPRLADVTGENRGAADGALDAGRSEGGGPEALSDAPASADLKAEMRVEAGPAEDFFHGQVAVGAETEETADLPWFSSFQSEGRTE